MDAKTITKFLDKTSIGIDTNNELMLDIKDGKLDVGLMNEEQTLFVHGSLDTTLPDAQVPISKFDYFRKGISTCNGIVEFELDKRLSLRSKNNIKRIPLCRWMDTGTRVISRITRDTEGILPVLLKVNDYAILTQDKNIFNISEVHFKQKDNRLNIQLIQEDGFESDTEIKDIHLDDGHYITPTIVFEILQKLDKIELAFTKTSEGVPLIFFREQGSNFVIKYVIVGMAE